MRALDNVEILENVAQRLYPLITLDAIMVKRWMHHRLITFLKEKRKRNREQVEEDKSKK